MVRVLRPNVFEVDRWWSRDWDQFHSPENHRSLVPQPVMTHPDRWRLDQLLTWEEKRMALAEAALDALVAPKREEVTIAGLLPQPKRRGRRSA